MALEASDQLIYIIWRCTCGCISRPTFNLCASLLVFMGKSKAICKDLKKKTGRPPQVCFILGNNFHTPEDTTFICTNTMGPRSGHIAQEGGTFCLLEMNVLWCEKCKSIPEQQQKDLMKMLEETGAKVSISTVKLVLYRHNLKGC